MKASKRKKIEADGWKVGSVAEFLGLTPEEELLVEMKIDLAKHLRQRRQRVNITQQELAHRIGSSQSRVAKIEKADKSVSMDLLISSLASLGASRKEIGDIIAASAMSAASKRKGRISRTQAVTSRTRAVESSRSRAQ
jgi:transcriptional regulator with XRE-family HTH domain